MKKHVMAALMAICATGAAADPILGLWQTQPDEGAYAHVEMQPCGDAICGTIAQSFKGGAAYASPNQGKTLVIDMEPNGNGSYVGKVWRPSNNKIYLGKMSLKGDQLALRGCVAGGLICSKQTWSRVK